MTWLKRMTDFMQKLPDPNDKGVTFTTYKTLTSVSTKTGEVVEEEVSAKLFVDGVWIGKVTLLYTIQGAIETEEKLVILTARL